MLQSRQYFINNYHSLFIIYWLVIGQHIHDEHLSPFYTFIRSDQQFHQDLFIDLDKVLLALLTEFL